MNKQTQQGFSLFMVLIVMLVIALMVVVGVQSANTEMRISTNDADRKLAMSLAETALRDAEKRIAQLSDSNRFSVNCHNGSNANDRGLCIPAGGVAPKPAALADEVFKIEEGQRMGNCQQAQCNIAAWVRLVNNKNVLDSDATAVALNQAQGQAADKPRYIIEYLNANADGSHYFRVTARARGKNPNTVVTVQTYVQAGY